MNNNEKVELILIFGECNRSFRQAARVYADRYPDRFHPNHNYVHRLLRGLNENGQFPNNPNRQRQPRPNDFDEDTELQPAHNAIIVRQHLNEIFPNRWIGTHGVIPWPARSPDLTPLDYFLWGHLKNIVYADPPIYVLDLKNKIRLSCNNIGEEQINASTSREFLKRLESCLEHQGGNFEQFIR
ncbi:uncharacterized protein LOC112680823 [Sipha flava]|uniref:Uncharacterized protein LOC112680823 n=1 Tax=Sipha flava TaxID=143950 RepID=A0A8B8F7T9_9HEMI|nr:uncharacterized protein LOC112680823 [Sipha flava]